MKRKSFTLKGYNDIPKSCPECGNGMVRPTHNANVGKCDKCGREIGWSRLLKK